MAKKEVEETYVSGEQYRSMQPGKRQSSHQVTLPVSGIIAVIIVVVLCVLSFAGGIQYQKGHGKAVSPATAAGGANGSGGRGFGGGHRMGGFGQVTAVSSTSITITNQRTNASTTYTITGSTTITDNGQTVTTSDIQTGDTVVVGTSGSGSTTATTILVNPSFGGGQGQSGGSSSGTSQSN